MRYEKNRHLHVEPEFFSVKLENLAREIVKDKNPRELGDSPQSTMESQIALTLSHISRLRQTNEQSRLSLLQDECFVNNTLIGIDARTPRYSSRRYPEEEKFKRRLLEIEKEKRGLTAQYRERMKELQDRLLDLMNRHRLID